MFLFPRFGSALVWLTQSPWSSGPLVLWLFAPLVLVLRSRGPLVLWFPGPLALDPLVFGCGFWKVRNTASYSFWSF